MSHPAPESTSIAAGALSALGASTCCVLPLVLVSIGVGGAWVAQLRELERFYYVFVVIAIGAFGYAFYRLYLRPHTLRPGHCVRCPTGPSQATHRVLDHARRCQGLVLSSFYVPYFLG